MSQILWLVLAWVAGTAATLGSLMVLGSLLLWLSPTVQARSHQTDASPLPVPKPWQNRLTLLAFSIAIALAGLGILVVVPFPSF
ncbi:hypothetical protein [Stenomitos frigidus]|uniref:Uncharacterized protein n=1 Tax=Stenomitos frigidus ULC18 TaxID=2107698 RepID=A0A2T1DTZ3_9CYAN|nr:hypothetical protein [Stenomitos frigidus]PSB23967.1 hypothetical protein C7B82_28820 [Stenomitos frigidus ULC18]